MEAHCSFVHYSLVKILFFDGCEYSWWFGFILAILDASLIRANPGTQKNDAKYIDLTVGA